MVSAQGKLPGRRPQRKPIGKSRPKKQIKKKAPFWNVQSKILLLTVFLFILAITAWTLLWLYISELKSVFPRGLGSPCKFSISHASPICPWVFLIEFSHFPDWQPYPKLLIWKRKKLSFPYLLWPPGLSSHRTARGPEVGCRMRRGGADAQQLLSSSEI